MRSALGATVREPSGPAFIRREGGHMVLGRSRFTLRTVLLLVAVILMVVAALGFDVKGISLLALGLAAGFAAFLFP